MARGRERGRGGGGGERDWRGGSRRCSGPPSRVRVIAGRGEAKRAKTAGGRLLYQCFSCRDAEIIK